MEYNQQLIYKNGTELFLADTLPRSYLPVNVNDSHMDFGMVDSVSRLRISPTGLLQLNNATTNDDNLQILKSTILNGWPNVKQTLPSRLCPYYSYKDELSVHDVLIFKGERVASAFFSFEQRQHDTTSQRICCLVRNDNRHNSDRRHM